MYKNLDDLFSRLASSPFRSRFHLDMKDKQYIESKGMQVIEKHTLDFVSTRLTMNNPKDGKQTPMKGHPVFKAQHATGCCCRGCLFKWHGIDSNHELTEEEKNYIVSVLMAWVKREMTK